MLSTILTIVVAAFVVVLGVFIGMAIVLAVFFQRAYHDVRQAQGDFEQRWKIRHPRDGSQT